MTYNAGLKGGIPKTRTNSRPAALDAIEREKSNKKTLALSKANERNRALVVETGVIENKNEIRKPMQRREGVSCVSQIIKGNAVIDAN